MLVCLQALDAGGKDGTIRHVMSGVNPQGVRVSSFKVPSTEELDHDYLWRYATGCPPAARSASSTGRTTRRSSWSGCTPRSWPASSCRTVDGRGIWDRRYREINDWERYLTDNGFTVVKLFLNLSKEEQRTRFLKRIDLPEKNWKFSAADARERRAVGRLPGCLLPDAVGDQHRVGPVVRHPGRPQVVRPDLRRRPSSRTR